MQLYSFFNRSTSYRVRIALELKRIAYEYEGVDSRVGAHRNEAYVAGVNPGAAVPPLVEVTAAKDAWYRH
ncbi:protein of unknown function (plasmid) [Caballeronia sp. S22]